ncbi:putative Mediator of RNA polymerase II transcription subunit 13 [Hibiscus syriacus]|uniref:Mediator of RNA polymerase II transcription subunit 13 n=1 Tax=Hibiscus syriacus TaxID=106335 RepID=A0A6A2X017_HIBSY|nr:putative Mediator of RNA polymerase II transcription subunit 13 [Hibiscus syriacus]
MCSSQHYRHTHNHIWEYRFVETTMRSLGYIPRQNSGWDTTSQDYQAHLSRMERLPTIIPGASQYPNVHRAFNSKVEFSEQDEQSAKSQKKVQVVDPADEATVNAEGDDYIQQKQKGFGLCKWKTFKMH